MDHVKRKSNFNFSSEEKMKKSRNEFDRSINCIENLSNEFFYEIFDYFDGCEIYQAFSNLNHRFHQLLHSSSLLFKLRLNHSTSLQLFLNNYQEIFLLHKDQIFSIYLSSSTHNNEIISSLNINSSLNHLESLDISSIQPDVLISLLPKLIHLPRFCSLNIDTWQTLKDLTDVYRLIFNLPKLTYLRFSAWEPELTDVTVSLPIAHRQQFTAIKYLVIDHPCTFNELFTILTYTPQICRLSYMHKNDDNISIEITSPIMLSNLTHLSIYGHYIMFDDFEKFITKIDSKLKVVSYTSHCEDKTYLDAIRWEEFILKYLPELKKFYFKYCEYINTLNEAALYFGKPNLFFSSFWIEHQWIFEAEIDLETVTYSIQPYKKKWYEDDTPYVTVNSSTQLSKSMRVVLRDYFFDDDLYYMKRMIFHVLSVTQVYHLEITTDIDNDTLIEILMLLVKLDSLQISSLSLSKPICWSDEETKVLSFLTTRNQITEVCLDKMIEIEEIYFLIELCPRMTYLKVSSINNIDIELFVRLIVMKIITQCSYPLKLLCFSVPAVDDEMIEKLKKMIYTEKLLLLDFTIKRVVDDIYLQWN